MIPQIGRHLLESTAFALIVALLDGLMRKRRAAARHAVWLLAAAKFAVPAALFSAAGVQLHAVFPTRPLLSAASPFFSSIVATPGAAASNASTGREIWVLLALLWLLGTGTALAVWTRRLLAPGEGLGPVLDIDKQAVALLGRRVGLSRPVELRYSKAEFPPSLSGVWHPTVTIPEGLREHLTPAEFEAVLLHELAHAKRADNLTAAFVHALVCLFWFHPLLWWIEWKLLKERELACDELVVRTSLAADEYVAGILKVCRFHLGGATEAACGITGYDLKKRLEAIMSFRSNVPLPSAPKFLVGALVSVMTVVPLAGGFLSGSSLLGQDGSSGKQTSAPRTSKAGHHCEYRSISFPEGTVILVRGMAGSQMCVAGPKGAYWDWSEDPARKARPDIIILPPEKPVYCHITPSPSPNLCACDTRPFSLGSLVFSADGKEMLTCDKGKWRPATRHEQDLE